MRVESEPRREPSTFEEKLDRWAPRLLAVYAVVAVPILLALGSDRWFWADEWDWLVGRSPTNLDDLLTSHNGHWTTLPFLLWRVVFQFVGIRSYLPYQALVVAVHLVTVWLLYLAIRRSEVRPWLAACATAPIVLFAPGLEDVIFAFQIVFVAPVALGLAQLLLADHGGKVGWRDGLAVAAGAGAVACSGVGLAMAFGVGVALLIRRGWRRAALQTVPLAVLFFSWFVPYGTPTGEMPSVWTALDWVGRSLFAAFEGIAGFWPMAVVVLAAVVGGAVLVFGSTRGVERRRRLAVPVGLAAAAVAFGVLTAAGRSLYEHSEQSGPGAARYLYVAGALLLPLIAAATEELVRRWRWVAPIVVVALLVPVVGQMVGYEGGVPANFYDRRRGRAVAIAYSPLLDEAPRWVEADPGTFRSPGMTVGFLRQMRDEGKLPPRELNIIASSQVPLWLGLAQRFDGAPSDVECDRYGEPLELDAEIGDRFLLLTSARASYRRRDGEMARSIDLRPADGAIVEVTLDEDFVLQPAPSADSFTICR